MTTGARYLRTWRNRPLYPHRVLEAVAGLLVELGELCEAIEIEIRDGRWHEAALAIDAARTWTLTPHSHTERARARRSFPTAIAAPSSRRVLPAPHDGYAEIAEASRPRRARRGR